MSKHDILLNTLIAERFLGLPPREHEFYYEDIFEVGIIHRCAYCGAGSEQADNKCVLPYAKDINAAWQVVEALHERGLMVSITSPTPGGTSWTVKGWSPKTNSNRFCGIASDVKHAICLAALDSCGIRVQVSVDFSLSM